MLDYLDEIESDLSVFHRVDDLGRLSSPRFFMLARLLPSYQGALQNRLSREQPPQQSSAPVLASEASVESLAALTDAPGLPGIEYTGGG